MKLGTLQTPAKQAGDSKRTERGQKLSTPAGDEAFLREVHIAKQKMHQAWRENDVQRIVDAIRSAVAAELILRDNREHEIPLDGKLYADSDEPARDGATGQAGPVRIEVDPKLKGRKHGYESQRLEARRRLYALILKGPHPSRFYELLDAIEQDDGRDAEGEWLCRRDGYPLTGNERLPKWLDLKWGQRKGGPAKSGQRVPEPAVS